VFGNVECGNKTELTGKKKTVQQQVLRYIAGVASAWSFHFCHEKKARVRAKKERQVRYRNPVHAATLYML
jgi:hypothetical protein